MTTGGYYSKIRDMDKKTKLWIIIFAVLVVAGLLSYFAINHLGGGTIAVITINGEEYERIDLSRVTESYDIEIDTGYGHNVVHVEPGRIAVTEANCPDKICVAQGYIERSGIPITCMPHRLVVKIEGGDIDG